MTISPGSIVIVLGDRRTRDLDRTWAEQQLATLLGADTARIERHCENCGSTDHGRPETAGAFVSLSRAADTVALAVSRDCPVGVDIESLEAIAAAPFDDVAFAGNERPNENNNNRAALWSAKEAVLKLLGTGLRTDPRTIRLDSADGIRYPDRPDLMLEAFDVGEGVVGVVAGATGYRVEVSDLRAGAAVASNRSSAG